MKVFLFILIFIFAACSPQQRFQKIVEKNPELIKQVDTTYEYLTIYQDTGSTDTFISIQELMRVDSFTKIDVKERVKIQVKYRDSIVYFEGSCLGDSSTIKVPTYHKTFDATTKTTDWIKILAITGWGLFIATLLIVRSIAKK